MKLYTTVSSERATKGQGGNEYIIIDINVGQTTIGQVEIVYNDDISKGHTSDEWVLQYRRVGGIEKDWTILDQDHCIPEIKGKQQKDNQCGHPLCGKTICHDNVPL
jgi:hypothetical protein